MPGDAASNEPTGANNTEAYRGLQHEAPAVAYTTAELAGAFGLAFGFAEDGPHFVLIKADPAMVSWSFLSFAFWDANGMSLPGLTVPRPTGANNTEAPAEDYHAEELTGAFGPALVTADPNLCRHLMWSLRGHLVLFLICQRTQHPSLLAPRG